MRAVVVRHYKTLINASGEIMGWGDAPPVKGWETDLAYVDHLLRNARIEFDAVHSSCLERARQTARYYARGRRIPLIHDAVELNEINYGSLFRKKKQWVEENYPQYKRDLDFVHPDGESFRQMQARSVQYIHSLLASRRFQTILVVVHAGVIRGLISHFLDLDYADHLRRKVSHRYIGDFEFDESRCVRYNELGKPSGFVRDGIIEIPWQRQFRETA